MTSPWSLERANEGSTSSGWPRVAILHSFYRSAMPSGENLTVRRQFKALSDLGVDVTLVSVASDDLARQTAYALRTGLNVAIGGGLSPEAVLGSINPEIIHIHNLFPNISTRWLKVRSAPVVTTLHNYRSLCAAATLSRDGHDCTLCIDGSPLNALRHRCYRGSALATLPLTLQLQGAPSQRPLLRHSDLLLVPSRTVESTYLSAGIGHLRLLLQPTEPRGPGLPHASTEGYLFIGRLTQEKGILELLEAWPRNQSLTVIGDGPLFAECDSLARSRQLSVEFLGRASAADLYTRLRHAKALLFVSTWREGAPAVYAEAMSAGVPVISLAGNAVAELVEHDRTGSVVSELTERALVTALASVEASGDALRRHCEGIYETDYTFTVWLRRLRSVYAEAEQRFRDPGKENR